MRKAIAAFLALMLVASSAALAEPAWMDYDCGHFTISFPEDIDGYIDEVDRCHGSSLPVSNGAGVYADAVGEHVIALLMAVLHGICSSVDNMKDKQWRAFPMLGNVNGKTVAVLGTGDIGNNAARICKAMGAHVLGYKLHPCAPFDPYEAIYTGDDGLDALLPAADIVLICLPGSPYTKNLLGARRVALMKDGVVIINVSRGANVDEAALLDALNSGKVKAAGLDVWLSEKDPNWELAAHPAVSCMPHVGAGTKEAQKRIGAELVDIIEHF